MPDVPDKLEATADKTSYQPGETAKLFVKAPFAGEAEIAIASDRILAMRSISLPARRRHDRCSRSRPAGAAAFMRWSAPTGRSALKGPQPRGPGRAVGVAWLGVDPAPRTLRVDADRASMWPGRADRSISRSRWTASPAARRPSSRVAAVDEAVLKLTEFDSPAPEKYFYGKRRLGVELRDLYGRLIDPRANGVGVLRSGGDQFAKRSVAGLPDKSSRVVALFSGPVRVDDDGAGNGAFRCSGLPGPAAADGGRVFAPTSSARARQRSYGPRSGRDAGVAAALSGARRQRPDRGRRQQPRGRTPATTG